MGKASKQRSRFSTKNCIVAAFLFAAVLTVVYEVAIFYTLDHRISNINYLHFAALGHRPDDIGTSGSFDRIHADVVLHQFSGFHDNSVNDVGNEEIINSVYYVWCENKTFNFMNYLSVLSVWKILQPDVIEFHRKVPPKEEKYDTWFEELKQTIPNLAVRDLPQHWDGNDKGCGFWFGLAVIDDRGGIYVGENIILNDDIIKYRKEKQTIIYSKFKSDEHSSVAVAMGKFHDDGFRAFRRQFSESQIAKEDSLFCEVIEPTLKVNTDAPCYLVNGRLFPFQIFDKESKFAALARRLMYGSESIKTAKPMLPGTIPRIVHYVWFGIKDMDFMMYLSMLSTLYIVNPEKVFVHTDGGLTGKLWFKLLKDKRIVLIRREKPLDIYGHQILYAQHRSDIVRAECLLKYGGIYMDWDVLWLKNPDDLLTSGYDAIANFDHMQQGRFPETINLGVLMAKSRSTFIKKWQDSLINYRSEDFLYNAVLLPYKVYEKYPEYLYIERRLQVMCFRLKCHPTFRDDFKNFMEDQPFDWREDVYSIHFTFPDPNDLLNEDSCRNGDSKWAQMGRYILTYEKNLPQK